MKHKCIIFDCDGVLVDSEILGNEVLIAMASEVGANIDMEYAIENFTGTSIQYVVELIQSKADRKVPDNFIEEYRRRSYEAFQKNIQPIQGVKELVEKLTIPYCSASNGPIPKMTLNLKATGLYPYFEGKLFSAYDIKKWKPDPALFLNAAKTMGFEPEDCAVVEDSPSGVKAAIAGGFKVYGFANNSHYEKELRELGATIFYSMNELQELLK